MGFATLVEMGILIKLKVSLISDGSDPMPLNSYLVIKWLQGHIVTFTTFMHICFVASSLMCLAGPDDGSGESMVEKIEHEIEAELAKAQSADASSDAYTMIILQLVSSILAVLAIPILLFANVRRAIYICKNIRSKPGIHKLLPKMQRNTQLANILNYNVSAVCMDSTSLSDYIYENGEPVIAGKPKNYPPSFKNPKVSPIVTNLVRDKMRLQDIPMTVIMTVHLFASIAHENQLELIISLLQIASTAASILSAIITLRWHSAEKGVDIKLIRGKMINRIKEVEAKKKKQEEEKDNKEKGSMSSLKLQKKKAKDPMESSDDTINSKRDNTNSKKVLQEIEMINMAKQATKEALSDKDHVNSQENTVGSPTASPKHQSNKLSKQDRSKSGISGGDQL
jgi:hypothetical protein